MTTCKAIVQSPTGIHARPASDLVNFTKQFKSKIFICNDTKKAAAGSIIMILTLGAKKGTELTVTAEGEDEAQAAQAVAEFIEGIAE